MQHHDSYVVIFWRETKIAGERSRVRESGLEIFFQTNLSCRASAPKNSLVLPKNLLALLFRSENEKKLKKKNFFFFYTEAKHVNEYG